MPDLVLLSSDLARQVVPLRGTLVLLDYQLANLYGIETRALKQAVRRNPDRFPPDFFFELTDTEVDYLVSQSVIPSKSKLGGAKPFAFTEQGVAMLSSVLSSERAIKVNIAIMRTFVEMRRMFEAHTDLALRLDKLEDDVLARITTNEADIRKIFEVLTALIQQNEQPPTARKQVGFKQTPNPTQP